MAQHGQREDPEMPVLLVLAKFLEWSSRHNAAATYQWYRRFFNELFRRDPLGAHQRRPEAVSRHRLAGIPMPIGGSRDGPVP